MQSSVNTLQCHAMNNALTTFSFNVISLTLFLFLLFQGSINNVCVCHGLEAQFTSITLQIFFHAILLTFSKQPTSDIRSLSLNGSILLGQRPLYHTITDCGNEWFKLGRKLINGLEKPPQQQYELPSQTNAFPTLYLVPQNHVQMHFLFIFVPPIWILATNLLQKYRQFL
jgi:hypothetical protein